MKENTIFIIKDWLFKYKYACNFGKLIHHSAAQVIQTVWYDDICCSIGTHPN